MVEQIKKLREATGAGIIECKQAYISANQDFDKALEMLKSAKAHVSDNQRVASKGLTRVMTKDDEAILFEVNGETDFLSKNEHFLNMLDLLAIHLMASDVTYPKAALKVMIDGKSVLDHLAVTSNLVKETLTLRRFHRIRKAQHHAFGSYMHLAGKVSTLVIINKHDEKLAKELAMHIAAMEPIYMSRKTIDSETMAYERMIYEKSHNNIDEETFERFLREKSLYDQPMIRMETMTVGDVLASKNVEVVDFFRFELGQGIENKLNCRLDIPCDGSKITVTPVYENSLDKKESL